MGTRCKSLRTVPLCFLILILIAPAAQAADCGGGIVCSCGDTVVGDHTLAADLICPAGFSGNALTIGADGITIDGGGSFKVEAPDAVAVIKNRLHSYWTLRNIAIKGGVFGIQSDARSLPTGAEGISILDVDVASPQDFGHRIRFLDTHSSLVEDSQADGGKIGIYNLNGDGNHYVNTSTSWLPEYGPLPAGQNIGMELIGVRDNLIEGIAANGRKIGVVIEGNTASPDWGNRASDDNVVKDSNVSGNEIGISFSVEGDRNQFLNNNLSHSTDVALAVNGDSGVMINSNDYSHSFKGIALSNLDALGRTVIAGADLTTISGTYGLRLHNVRNSRFEWIQIGGGARQSMWWSGGSTGNEFHQIMAHGHTFGLLSQDAHDNLVTDSDFSWIGPTTSGDGLFLDHSTGNTIRDSAAENRDVGLRLLSGSDDNQVRCNFLRDNREGALNRSGAGGNHLNLNLIAGNSDFGVRNTDASPLDAEENYWGAADGPSPPGSGDAISGPVDVTPFFSAPGDLDGPCGRAGEPNLLIPDNVGAAAGERVEVPVVFTANGHDIATVAFSVDYDQSCLDFDPIDADQNNIPDNVSFQLPAGFTPTVFVDLGDSDGELDVLVANIPPTLSLPDGVLAVMTFTTTCTPAAGHSILAPVGFSLDPAASFGNTQAQSVPGTTADGSVEIYPGIRGDCNGDGWVDAADVGACGLEIYDGDGDHWLDVGAGYPGSPVGCDSNADRIVDAGDLSCTSRLIFGGTCGAGRSVRGAEQGPRLTMPADAAVVDGVVRVPVELDDAGHAISSLVFSLDLDPELVSFDPTDLDQDGVPDAVEFINVPSSIRSVRFEPEDAGGELDFLFTDLAAEPQAIAGGLLLEITFQVADPTATSADGVRFSSRPPASFGDVTGAGVAGHAHLVPEALFADGFESGDTSAWTSGRLP